MSNSSSIYYPERYNEWGHMRMHMHRGPRLHTYNNNNNPTHRTSRQVPLVSTPIIPVSKKHPIGSIFEINGLLFHAELDSGEEEDIQITLKLAQALGLGTEAAIHSAGVSAGKWPKPHNYTRIWVNFGPPGLPPVRTTATIRAPKGTPYVPLTLITASGYSVTISPRHKSITYTPAHEGGVPYTKPWNARDWAMSPEHRTPPYLNFSVDGQEYPALLDTGSWIMTFTSATARILGITNLPRGPMVKDYGLSQSYIIPLQLDGVRLVVRAIISDKYPGGNLVPASHFIDNGIGD